MLEKVSNQSERSTTEDSETDAPSTACAETVSNGCRWSMAVKV